jgi:spore coat polysaccharide biosynthesis protein SpsF (cytidylyltransferase family)
VTLLVREQPERFAVAAVPAAARAVTDVRLDVDYAEDLDFLRAVCQELPADRGPYWTVDEIVAAARQQPAAGTRREGYDG